MITERKYLAPKSLTDRYPQGIGPRPTRKIEWVPIVNYLYSCADIRKSICVSCRNATIYDKNDIAYKIQGRIHSLEKVKEFVEKIRKINAGNN